MGDKEVVVIKLKQLDSWMKMNFHRLGQSTIHDDVDQPFLLLQEKPKNLELRFLPAFRLIGTFDLVSNLYDLSLVNYSGKNLNQFQFEKGESLSGKIPDWVQDFIEGSLGLCRGLPNGSDSSFQLEEVFVEQVVDRIVTRSRMCLYAVKKHHSQLCSECEMFYMQNKSKNRDDKPLEESTTKTSQYSESLNFVPVELIKAEQVTVEVEHGNLCEEFNIKIEPDPDHEILADDDDDDGHSDFIAPDYEEENDDIKRKRKQGQPRNTSVIKTSCLSCHQVFPWLYLYQKHLKENRSCKMFLRNKRKEERQSLKKFDNIQKSKVIFNKKCTMCLDNYTVERNYEYDQKQHAKLIGDLDSPVKCPSCDQTIQNKRVLNVHFETEHTTNSGKITDLVLCLICLRPMKKKYVKIHYSMKHIQREHKFLCNVCGKRSKTKGILELHLANKHGLSLDLTTLTVRHFCDVCGKSYPSIEVLRQHISIIHKKGRNHPCDLCKKVFYTNKGLITHKVCIHLKIHPFKCKMCDYTAGEMTTVYKHYQMKHGFRGTRQDVFVIQDELQRVREIFKYNYCGFSAKKETNEHD